MTGEYRSPRASRQALMRRKEGKPTTNNGSPHK